MSVCIFSSGHFVIVASFVCLFVVCFRRLQIGFLVLDILIRFALEPGAWSLVFHNFNAL